MLIIGFTISVIQVFIVNRMICSDGIAGFDAATFACRMITVIGFVLGNLGSASNRILTNSIVTFWR